MALDEFGGRMVLAIYRAGELKAYEESLKVNRDNNNIIETAKK